MSKKFKSRMRVEGINVRGLIAVDMSSRAIRRREERLARRNKNVR